MRVTMTSAVARTGRTNEDFTGALPTAAVLVDGAGIPGTATVCRHGVAWYANRLGSGLLGLLSLARDRSLPELLAEVIERVTDDHRDTCDVAATISPSAAVAVLRLSGGLVEYLVLGDATLVLDRADGAPLVVTDPREVVISRPYASALEATAEGSDAYHRVLRELRANRNQPGGFWVAKDDPGRPTKRSPVVVRSPSWPVPLCSATGRPHRGPVPARRLVGGHRPSGIERTRRRHPPCPSGGGPPLGGGGRCDDRALHRPRRGLTAADRGGLHLPSDPARWEAGSVGAVRTVFADTGDRSGKDHRRPKRHQAHLHHP